MAGRSIIGRLTTALLQYQIITDILNRECVSGRELHAFLGIEKDYEEWFDAMKAYCFEEGTDFTIIETNTSPFFPKIRIFSEIYKSLVGERFADILVDYEKCEKITVFRQFVPYYYLNNENEPAVIDAHKRLYDNHISKYLTIKF